MSQQKHGTTTESEQKDRGKGQHGHDNTAPMDRGKTGQSEHGKSGQHDQGKGGTGDKSNEPGRRT
jgi:hypothetical protein